MFADISRIASGQLFAQLINFIALPFLTRLYGPESFGVFAIFSATAWISVVFATGQAEHLVITMTTTRRALALTLGILGLVSSTSIILVLVFGVVFNSWPHLFIISNIVHVSFLIGLTVFLIGSNQALRYYATYTGSFRGHGVSAILTSVGTQGVCLGYAIFIDKSAPVNGLIYGQITGLALSLIPFLLYTDIRYGRVKTTIRLVPKVMQSQLGNIPVFLATHLSKTMHTRLPVLIVGVVAGGVGAGAYAMAERLIGMPTGLFGQAIGQVVRHRFKVDSNDGTRSVKQPQNVIKITFGLALLAYSLFIYIADWFVLFVLGKDWEVAIPIVRIVAVMAMLNLVFYSVEDVAVIRRNFRYRMLWQLSQLLLLGTMYIGLISIDYEIHVEVLVAIIVTIRVLFVLYDLLRTWRNVKSV